MNPINTTMLIEILKKLSPEITSKTLPYLLSLESADNTFKNTCYGQQIYPEESDSKKEERRRHGKRNRDDGYYVAYWPDHDSWSLKATEVVCSKNYQDSCSNVGIDRLKECCPASPEGVVSLNVQMTSIFNTVFKKFFYEDTDNIKASLSELLRIYDAPDSEILKICNFDHYKKISQYIVDKAQLNGQLDKNNKKPILTLSLLEERYKQYNNRISSSNSTTYVKSPRHFSFSHLRSILEGSQPNQPCWAEELCKSYGLPDIQIPSALCDCMTLRSFENDSDFMNTILPHNLLLVILPEADSSEGIADLMQGTHSDALRRTACEELQCSFSKDGPSYLVDDILKKCKSLNLSENQFFTVYETLFKILGDKGERLLRYQLRCQTPTYPYIGMAMLIVYALLGEKYFYHMIPNETLVEKYFHQIRP